MQQSPAAWGQGDASGLCARARLRNGSEDRRCMQHSYVAESRLTCRLAASWDVTLRPETPCSAATAESSGDHALVTSRPDWRLFAIDAHTR